MTPSDEAKGRILSDYSSTKSRLADLKGQAGTLIQQLKALASQIDHYESAPVNYDLGFLKTDFQKLMNDLQTTARELAALQGKLHDLGVDVK
jgi:flagellar biosynthesis chaperone FliJ